MLPPVLLLHLRCIEMASLCDVLVVRVLVFGLGKEEPALEQAIPSGQDRPLESGTSLMVPVRLNLPEIHGFNASGLAPYISYFSTPAALAACVAIASINGGDKQS